MAEKFVLLLVFCLLFSNAILWIIAIKWITKVDELQRRQNIRDRDCSSRYTEQIQRQAELAKQVRNVRQAHRSFKTSIRKAAMR